MAERLRIIHPVEASVILLNEIFFRVHSPKVAQALHGNRWEEFYYTPPQEEKPVKLEHFLQDSQRSQLLVDRMTELFVTVRDREKRAVQIRFGFKDGILHTLKETSEELGFTSRERPRQLIAKALRKLRHPSRSKRLREFLPENQ